MKVHGSCYCGQIQFLAEIDPKLTSICHCTDCQKLTGTAFRVSTPAQNGTFVLLSGKPTIYVKVAESGAQRAQAFCPNCGSPLYTYDVSTPHIIGLRVGALAERASIQPTWQKWCRSALPWTQHISQLEQAQGNDRSN